MGNIILIGMPGAGKSTIGVLLAKALGMSFIDTDLVMQKVYGRLLQDIIDAEGIHQFLLLEEKIILSLNEKKTVIATGGSAVYSEKAMSFLKKHGIVLYLKVSLNEIVDRIHNITTRGIILDENQTIQDIYRQRVPLYDKYADTVIDCSQKSVEVVLRTILKNLN